MAQLKAGTRLKSSVCATEVMVIAAPDQDVAVTCGGAPMVDIKADPISGATLQAGGEAPKMANATSPKRAPLSCSAQNPGKAHSLLATPR